MARHNLKNPKQMSVAVDPELHGRLCVLAGATGQTIRFWTDLILKAHLDNAGDLVQTYNAYKKEMAEKDAEARKKFISPQVNVRSNVYAVK